MNQSLSPRSRWLLWLLAFTGWIALWLFPVSNRLTRTGGIVLAAAVWIGLIIQIWPVRWLRISLLALSLVVLVFAVAPSLTPIDRDALRQDYLTGLQRYRGVSYFWGGESPKGIDCSGLMRRGLIDALFLRSLRTLDPGLFRLSFNLWWHDSSAEALGKCTSGWTVPVIQTPNLNTLDHSQILPGDMAVTSNGIHVLAYLGQQRWIEADPGVGRVIEVDAPAKDNPWFQGRMTLVRWQMLQP